MGERVVEKEKVIKERTHEFYCDECNAYIGKSEECDDGYYEDIGKTEYKFNLGGWYKLKKTLCDYCRKKFNDKIRNQFIDWGFEPPK